MLECSPSEQLGSLPPSLPRPPAQKWDTTVLSSEALCLQYNVAEGNGADTTGNLLGGCVGGRVVDAWMLYLCIALWRL